ncbi:type IV pilus modification protein PilV [Roseateles sp. BYS87W]|uniref:Type IV pilus modification protein PilV n=1 Tax=Pelomonas baiyunensis TaxID=3299026 RepID=A0ABW7GTU7_9BURK
MLNLQRKQSGVMLLEVLISLLIFALGVLGLVGLQANAVKQSGQSKYRTDATMLANELIGQMWMSNRTFATLSANFASANNGAPFTNWRAKVQTNLPGATTYPPTVVVTQIQPLDAIIGAASAVPVGLTPSSRVTITVRWKAPGEPAADPAHSFVLINEIK